MKIELSKDQMRLAISETQSYFRNELDAEIGDLKAEMIVEFFIAMLGPKIYNQAIDDSGAFIRDKLSELESILYAPDKA
ncbi:MAG: DUF2164 domain-containing protein [Desulfuromonas sp.]|nr:MAG: DUF2164 domain-containing protein [Desulfuromonas sp.]